MKLCPRCNFQNPDSDSYCRVCGLPLDAAAEQSFTVPLQREEETYALPQYQQPQYPQPQYQQSQYPQPQYPQQGYPPPPQPKRKSSRLPILITVVLVALILTGGAVIIFSNRAKETDESTTAASAAAVSTTQTTAATFATEPPTTKDKVEFILPETAPTTTEPTTEAPTTTTGPTTSAVADPTRSTSGYLFPSDSQLLTTEYLDTLSNDQIDLIRNEIYARHGYIFRKEKYRTYFQSQSWYRGTESDMDKVQEKFNDYEMKNIDILVKYQGLAP